MEKDEHKFKYLIISIYFLVFLFFVFKMFFYAQYVGGFPDEIEHVSYIAYLEKSHKIIPDFKNMTVLEPTKTIDNNNIKNATYTFGGAFNYLGHPPLYYQIMRLSGAVKIVNNTVIVNFIRLRSFNIALSSLAILLILYIGYSRIGKNPLLHLLYAAIVVSVPMLAYNSAGINNDTLALIGLSVFVFGLLRFSEENRNFSTYLIISLGVFISFMSKLTAGLVVFIASCIYIILIIIKEKDLSFLISKKLFATLPVYIVTALYYIIVYLQTGSIQPTYKLLDPKDFYASGFYVPVANRTHMNFTQYIVYFSNDFLRTWTGIASNVSLIKIDSLFSVNNIALLILLFLPIILLFQMKKVAKKYPIVLVAISVYLGLAISAVIQCIRAYKEYVNISGYMGGYQSRYYLCGISAIALAITFSMKNFFEKLSATYMGIKRKLTVYNYEIRNDFNFKKLSLSFICLLFICLIVICLFFICLLFYEDFIYFIIYFKNYL
ncbi:hypothetical protein [Clostridium pasteurianum]|uniref:Glycosyltransferase RgtA/B/C/D-like domain-containing protein n=1 Tax=Clostridium pasteurianum BC1 TaxID=86416 RepID=R4K801_CLOPA|nr:hypothetical protein [Clostridium pasteurianum]AGK97831.1 hypothetical protein Clopa_3002 [Clostridium pasteurianum BC1]